MNCTLYIHETKKCLKYFKIKYDNWSFVSLNTFHSRGMLIFLETVKDKIKNSPKVFWKFFARFPFHMQNLQALCFNVFTVVFFQE